MRQMLERLSELRKIKDGPYKRQQIDLGLRKAPMLVMKMVIDYLHYNLYLK